MPRVLLLFVDGVGLGATDAGVNPFLVARLPTFDGLLEGVPVAARGAPQHYARSSLVGVDAILGFAGIPQSGTGQAALLTGSNAVEMHGRHFGPWVPSRLRPLVRQESVLARALGAGYTGAFANAYPEEVKELIGGDTDMSRKTATLPSDVPGHVARARRGSTFLRAGPPLAALGAGLLTRHTPELERGEAVASELTNEGWRTGLGRTGVPAIDAVQAGLNLARIASAYDITLFAHYATDYAGHEQDMAVAVRTLEKLDAFLAGLIEGADENLLIVVVSDHGNIEDVRTGHTRNPALGLVVGTGHAGFARRLKSLVDITPAIMDVLAT
ncbi:MAG: alkaline phosphatase family protein [Gemmatimonadetes bacterium]|nr:alkaline phosphatase family protein [Gemmatimonadota bacterium]